MNKKDKEESLRTRKSEFLSLRSELGCFSSKLAKLKKHSGHSVEFKLLMLAIAMMKKQVEDDYERYERRLSRREERLQIKDLQKSLNREREKREALEQKVKNASESSGLFIKYVRDKFRM